MENKFLEQAFSVIDASKKANVGHVATRKIMTPGERRLEIKGEKFVTFSLSDYLMLMQDERIKQGAIESIKNNGFNLSISREYMRLHIVDEAEEILSKVFGNPVVLYPKTTLAHVGALPLLIDRKDAIIIDHHAHSTIAMASDICKAHGTHFEVIRHNNVELLEKRIIELRKTHPKIWYLADGVYSMHGDVAPVKELNLLMDKYEEFYTYIDDAHGISWAGPNGSGYVLSQGKQHSKMILAVSFGKGYGAGGGAIICPNEEIKTQLLYLSGPLMFTGPLESSTLGGLIAASEIHLSKDIIDLQNQLKELIDYFYDTVQEMGLPLADYTRTPTAYFPVGRPDTTLEFVKAAFNNNLTVTAGIFPAVPFYNSGIRIQITLYQNKADIDHLLNVMKSTYEYYETKDDFSLEEVLKKFKK
ncbi:MAG: aminotransferase class I/II-fold pyridoxal phosphate-dependent enzyme [Bacteroidales bacterium]|nr:aminotransferase class I/II-fold pyridoxal phosphate-dependent enzyme [Bacteroidales bacterium]